MYRIQQIDRGKRLVAQLARSHDMSSSPSMPAPRARGPSTCPGAPRSSSVRIAVARAPLFESGGVAEQYLSAITNHRFRELHLSLSRIPPARRTA